MWVCVVVAHMFYSIDCVCFLFFVFFPVELNSLCVLLNEYLKYGSVERAR